MWTMVSSGVAEFIGVFPGGHRVDPVSLGSLRCALEVVGFFRVAGFNRVRHCGRRDHPWSRGSLVCTLVVVGFIRGLWVLWGRRVHQECLGSSGFAFLSLGSFGVAGFIGVYPRRFNLRSLWCSMGVVSLIHWGASWECSG